MKSTIGRSDLKQARQVFETRIKELMPEDVSGVGLALSGGTDSATILFSLLAVGIKPHCFTFHMEGIESTDLQSARALANHFGLKLTEVVLPIEAGAIVSDIRQYLDKCENTKKTVIQCMHPWLYLYPAMKAAGITLLLNGLGGDDLYCNQRKVQVALHRDGEEGIFQYRKVYSDDLRFSAANIMRWGKDFGIDNIDFYNDEKVINLFLQFEVKAFNKPMEKWLSVGPFPDYYSQGGFYRKHDSYQINSGLKQAHEGLLKSPFNIRSAKDVLSIYNDIVAGKV